MQQLAIQGPFGRLSDCNVCELIDFHATEEPEDEADEVQQQAQLDTEVEDMFELEGVCCACMLPQSAVEH